MLEHESCVGLFSVINITIRSTSLEGNVTPQRTGTKKRDLEAKMKLDYP